MSATTRFSYEAAFGRNVGLLDEDEMRRVRRARIGVAGLGGCGGHHLITLARMGFERFSIADLDTFEPANLNRQAGAMTSTLGQAKVDVMRRMVLDINPGAEVGVYPEGITATNLAQFADETDLGINAIDFLRIDLYAGYHDRYREQGKYSIVGASPFAFGAAMTVVGPETPSFDQVFGMDPQDSPETRLKKFVDGMTPDGFARHYLAPGINEIQNPLSDTRISSSAAALCLCAALTAAEVLFIVTARRAPTLAPNVLEFDLLSQSLAVHRKSGQGRGTRLVDRSRKGDPRA